jgi:hypothetical protein
MKTVMAKSHRNMILYTRIFVVIRLLIAAISAIVVILLGNFYITQLTTRSQAVQTSFDAQSIAAAQQNNLESMNASLQARYYQVFASLSKIITDPSLSASAGLINSDILARQADFEQTLALYQSNYELVTSDNMSTIRTILLNDNPTTGPAIINNQQVALEAVSGPTGLWAQYRILQDQTLTKLQTLESTPPTSAFLLNRAYNSVYLTLWQANKQFIDLRNTWQIVVGSAVTTGKTVSTVGPSVTMPVYVFNFIFICTMLLIFTIDLGFTNFQLRRSFLLFSEGKNSGNTPVPPSGSIPPVLQLP